ncbi:MAG: SDR family oxidoreductase [Rhizomicrobium sp.]|jgi:NAD(P)-dependent dehydrogenase (short-subunit alcohol dehydrogenase family)
MTTILVTGANRGIGLEFVRQYGQTGNDVIACCRKPSAAVELRKIADQAKHVKLHTLDVADPESIRALKRELGDVPFDILINNAGVGGPDPQTAEAIDYDQWLTTFRVNAMAPLIVAQAFHENLHRGQEKKLVTITSGLGSTENNTGGGWYGYRASKAAVNNVMRGLAHDWAKDGIHVGIFAPGWVRTDMGGTSGPLSVEQSVKNLRVRIDELDARTSGHYLDHTGQEIAW